MIQNPPCSEVDPNIFYPEGDGSHAKTMQAKRICGSCPLVISCLNTALANNEEYGIWGGSTPAERKAIRRSPARKELHLYNLKRGIANDFVGKTAPKKSKNKSA